jgi:hypothetical protein
MEAMVPFLQAELKRNNGSEVTSFFNFFDLEIAVSDPLLSTNCPPLAKTEMVVFIKFKEKMMTNDTSPRTPRSVLIPVCITPCPGSFPFVVARIWELYSPRWEHEDMITTDPATIIYLKTEVLKNMEVTVVETAQKALRERKAMADGLVVEETLE